MKGINFEIEEGILLSYSGSGGHVVIPEGVETIGQRVFYGNRSITAVTFPASLEKIEESAFFGCSELSRINFSTGLKTIENHAFASCSGLKELILPEGLTVIGQSAFSPCAKLTRIVLPSSLEELGEFAFSCCRMLQEISLPDSLERIDRSAFSMCTALKRVVLPASLRSLVRGVFLGCTSLRDITLKENIASVENNAFSGCMNLINVNVSEDNPFLKDIDGVLYSRDGKCLKYFPGGRLEIVIPDDVTEIGKEAFYENRNFDTITLPSQLRVIADSAFFRCSELLKIDFPDGLREIGVSAFDGCIKLESLYMPDSLKIISESAFRNCRGLMWIRLPEDLAFDIHWFCAPHDPPAFSADHTIIPFISSRPRSDIQSSIGARRASLGFIMAENSGVRPDTYLAADYTDHIRTSVTDYYDDMLENDDILRWLCSHRLIPDDDIERLLERAADSGRASASALLLDYQKKSRPHIRQGGAGAQEGSVLKAGDQLNKRFDALENALDF